MEKDVRRVKNLISNKTNSDDYEDIFLAPIYYYKDGHKSRCVISIEFIGNPLHLGMMKIWNYTRDPR